MNPFLKDKTFASELINKLNYLFLKHTMQQTKLMNLKNRNYSNKNYHHQLHVYQIVRLYGTMLVCKASNLYII